MGARRRHAAWHHRDSRPATCPRELLDGGGRGLSVPQVRARITGHRRALCSARSRPARMGCVRFPIPRGRPGGRRVPRGHPEGRRTSSAKARQRRRRTRRESTRAEDVEPLHTMLPADLCELLSPTCDQRMHDPTSCSQRIIPRSSNVATWPRSTQRSRAGGPHCFTQPAPGGRGVGWRT